MKKSFKRQIVEDDARAVKRAIAIFKDPERLAEVQKLLNELLVEETEEND